MSIGHDVISTKPILSVRGGKVQSSSEPEAGDVARLKKYLQQAKVVALNQSPFIYSLLSGIEIRTTDKVPIAGINPHGILYLNPKRFLEIAPEPKQGISILLHEALHTGFGHFKRVGNKNPEAYNWAGDAVINNALIKSGYLIDLPIYKARQMIDMRTIHEITKKDIKDLETLDADDIYDELMKNAKPQQKGQKGQSGQSQKGQKPENGDGEGEDGEDGENGETDSSGIPKPSGWGKDSGDIGNKNTPKDEPGKPGQEEKEGKGKDKDIIQEGNRDLYKEDPNTGKKTYDHKRALNKAKVDSEMLGHGMGTLPLGMQRIINQLTKPKVDWRSQLRSSLNNGIGSLITTTWQYSSRRFGELVPGTKMYTKPTVWCLIDTSGSISEPMLNQFMSEVYGISKQYQVPVKVMSFDASAYELVEGRTPGEIISKVLPKISGGGGTEIETAMNGVLEHHKFKSPDAFVIMSDGDIFDLNKPIVQKYLKTVSEKASTALFLSTRKTREELSKELPPRMKILEVRMED